MSSLRKYYGDIPQLHCNTYDSGSILRIYSLKTNGSHPRIMWHCVSDSLAQSCQNTQGVTSLSMKKFANSGNYLKRFIFMVLGGLLGIVLYEIGRYLITGQIDIEHSITFFIIWLIGGAIGFSITKMFV